VVPCTVGAASFKEEVAESPRDTDDLVFDVPILAICQQQLHHTWDDIVTVKDNKLRYRKEHSASAVLSWCTF